nr:hypothetical protein [Tanacetum cinerariifolium]
MQNTDEAEPVKMEEVCEVVTIYKLMTVVVTTATPITTTAQVSKASALRRRRGVVIQDPEETTAASVIMHSELEAELNANIHWNDVIEEVKRSEKQDNAVMRYQALKRKPLTEAQARKNMMIYLKMAGFKMDFFKATPLALKVPVVDYQIHHENNKPYYKIIRADGTHKLFLSFITLLKNFDREDLETLWKLVKERFKSTKPKNFSDDFLLNVLKIMFEKPNVEANVWRDQKGKYGLAKVPVVDYQIHHENNKPYYKIIRADGTHKLFLSFITLLKNFDREDLETLWKLVKEIFKSTKPKNFSDDFLLNNLKIMFEKPNVKANMFLLVEKKYPLIRFTLQQMLNNVRLKVKEESEMSLELLRLVRRQPNEGYVPE